MQIKKKTYCRVKPEHTASPNWRSRLKPTETEMCFYMAKLKSNVSVQYFHGSLLSNP